MTDAVDAPNVEDNTTQEPTEPTLYAGKYHSVEALEEGYKNATKLINDVKREKDEVTKVPEQYEAPEGFDGLPDDVKGKLTGWAKDAGLTQQHFAKMATNYIADTKSAQEAIDAQAQEALSVLGENASDKLSNIEQYAKANYSEAAANKLLQLAKTDKDVMSHLVEQREKSIGGSAPGLTSYSAPQPITKADITKAHEEYKLNPYDPEVQQKWVDINTRYAKQKSANG